MAISTYIGLPAIELRVRRALLDGVNDAADELAEQAEALAPVLTGTLAGGISNEGARLIGAGAAAAKVQTGPGADEYAIIQHQRRAGVKYLQIPLVTTGAANLLRHLAAAAARRL